MCAHAYACTHVYICTHVFTHTCKKPFSFLEVLFLTHQMGRNSKAPWKAVSVYVLSGRRWSVDEGAYWLHQEAEFTVVDSEVTCNWP